MHALSLVVTFAYNDRVYAGISWRYLGKLEFVFLTNLQPVAETLLGVSKLRLLNCTDNLSLNQHIIPFYFILFCILLFS